MIVLLLCCFVGSSPIGKRLICHCHDSLATNQPGDFACNDACQQIHHTFTLAKSLNSLGQVLHAAAPIYHFPGSILGYLYCFDSLASAILQKGR